MNLPNKLTIIRVILIIPFIILLLGGYEGWGIFAGIAGTTDLIACIIFIVASFTDFLDGYIARKYKLVTNFGKFMDPLADKLLVCAALIAFVELDYLPAWIVIIIISREFIISGYRLIAADKGVVIAANYWGKFKTVSQMIMTILLILQLDYPGINIVEGIFIYSSLALTLISLVDYIWVNRSVMYDDNQSGRDKSK